ncbi:MAG: hypothetical protein ACJ760_02310 [Thermoleophilaceae bacterium]
MGEFLPLLLGVAIGAAGGVQLLQRRGVAVALSVVAGAAASWINGELAEPWPILFDAAQVMVALAMTAAVMRRVQA